MQLLRCLSLRGRRCYDGTRLVVDHGFTIGALAICALALIPIKSASCLTREDSADAWEGLTSSCTAEDPRNGSVSCHGMRIVRKVVQQLLDQSAMTPSLELSKGVHLVEVANGGSVRRARLLKGYGTMGPVLEFLDGKELRVKLPSMMPDNLESALRESLPVAGQGRGKGGGGGFGGGKKGDGGVLLMALMMGKMMSALGFGALALLAMKALMVSALALMLSLIVAVKKLAGGHDDGGGHHVVYAQEVGGHHHRRRRSHDDGEDALHVPYRAYAELYS